MLNKICKCMIVDEIAKGNQILKSMKTIRKFNIAMSYSPMKLKDNEKLPVLFPGVKCAATVHL